MNECVRPVDDRKPDETARLSQNEPPLTAEPSIDPAKRTGLHGPKERHMHQSLFTMLLGQMLFASAALAQATSPGTSPGTPPPAGAPAAGGGFADYWWIILLVVIAAGAIWYFMRDRTRT